MFQRHSTKKDDSATLNKSETISSRKISPSILSSDIRILGNIISDGVLDIDGRIEGNVKAEAVYIRVNAIITGDVMVGSEAHIFGAVHGVIRAPRVCIYPSAHIEGAIIHRSLSIEDGAYVDAQFKPFDAQPLLPNNEAGKALSAIFNPTERGGAVTETEQGEDFDILKGLKLIS